MTDLAAPTGDFAIEFTGLARFELDFATREIAIQRLGAGLSDSSLNHLLVDQVWPRIIAHGGELVLHAAGVMTPQGAILIAGPSGRGKSTLSASLHQRGFSLLGDDAMIVAQRDGAPHCRAVYPSMRLFPDSIANLFDHDIGHSEVAHYTRKRNLRLAPSACAVEEWHEIGAIFFPAEDQGNAQIEANRLPPSRACMEMIEHSFWLDPKDVDLTAKKLGSAAAMVRTTPAFTLDFPRSFARLDEVHAAMFAALA